MSLTIAVLTGRRPELLQQTLDSFVEHHSHIWDDARRTVFHNSGDVETAEVLDRYVWHDRRIHEGGLLPIGEASQVLAGQVDSEYVLRLEDDWQACPVDWWDDAVALLDVAGQVRLRGSSEKVSPKCQSCRQPLNWQQHGKHRVSDHGHYTHNPSLMRTKDFLALFPYQNERVAGRRYHGKPIAQHQPGVFTHLGGDGRSLKHNGGGR